jgi:Zn finger protein HypA/HybF involved in hydrogenase expression
MGDLEERKRSQRLEQAIRNAITRLKEHDHALADGVCVVPKRGVCIVLEDLEKALLEDFAEEKAPREEEEDNVAYSFAGVELEVECSLCGGQGVVPSEIWCEWTDNWLAGERNILMPEDIEFLLAAEEHVACPLCHGKRRAITANGAKLIEFIERWVR